MYSIQWHVVIAWIHTSLVAIDFESKSGVLNYVFPPPLQFRFAKIWDILMIITGTLMAIGAGVALPGHMLMFGRVINQFVYYSIAAGNLTGLAAAAVNLTGSCDTATLRTIRANGSMGAGMMRNASVVQGCFGDTSQQQSSSVFDIHSAITVP